MAASFKSFEDVDLKDFRKTLEDIGQLRREVKGKLDGNVGLDTDIVKSGAKRNKAILDAIEGVKDEKTGFIASFQQKNDVKVLKGPIKGMLEYFKTLRSEVLPNQPAIELDISKDPATLLLKPVSLKYGAKPQITINKITGPTDYPLTHGLMYLLLLPLDTLKDYDLLKEITKPEFEIYIDVINDAGDGAEDANPKIIKIKDIIAAGPAKAVIVGRSIWEDSATIDIIQNGTIEDLAKFLEKNSREHALLGIRAPASPKFQMHARLGNNKWILGNIPVEFKKNEVYDIKLASGAPGKSLIVKKPVLLKTVTQPESKILILLNEKQLKSIIAELNSVGLRGITKLYDWTTYPDGAFDEYLSLITGLGLVLDPTKIRPNTIAATAAKKGGVRGFGIKPITGMGAKLIRNPQNPNPFNTVAENPKRGNTGLKPNESYVVKEGKFGDLEVDVPKMYTGLRLTAKKGGAIVLDKPIDKDGLELLTRRANPRKNYSKDAIKTLSKMMQLADHPVKRNSKKLLMVQQHLNKKRQEKGDANDNAEADMARLTTLIGEINAGNYPNKNLQNEVAKICDALLKQGLISKNLHQEIFDKYIL